MDDTRASYVMTAEDIIARYGYPERKPGPPCYPCQYGLGCEGPTCSKPGCPRKVDRA